MIFQILLAIWFIVPSAPAQEQVQLHIEVTGLRSEKGQLLISVYDSEKAFSERKGWIKQVYLKPSGTSVSSEISLPPGRYAFYVHHDENDNGKMDRNFFGMPKEGIAASRNATGFMGPPAYEDAVFELVSNKRTLKVKMNYL